MKALLLIQVHLWSLKNRFLARFRRLKQLRYLLGTIIGLAYFAMLFRRGGNVNPFMVRGDPDPAIVAALETGAAALLTLLALLAWLWPSSAAALSFSETEIAFLFPAPLTRRQVIDFSLIRSQPGILIGVAVTTLFGLRHLAASPWLAFVGAWILFTTGHLYLLAVSIVRSNLATHGRSGAQRSWPYVAAITAIVAVIAAPILSGSLRFPITAEAGGPFLWIQRVGESFPLRWVLLPMRAIVRSILAPDAVSFLLSLIPAAAVLSAAYLWVIRSDFEYEEASSEQAARRAASRSARARGERSFERVAASARRTPFRLKERGGAAGAIFWKNLLATWRITTLPGALMIFAGAAAASFLFAGILRSTHAPFVQAMGTICLVAAGVFTLAGGQIVRTDLRTDLLYVDLLRGYPVTGPAIVLGEISVPAMTSTLLSVLLVVAAVPCLAGTNGWSWTDWSLLGAGLILFAAPLNLLLALINNAAIVLFPAWHQLGPAKRHGFEMMGQNLIAMLGRLLALAVGLIPSALIVLAVAFFGWARLRFAVIPLAAVTAALPVLAECWVGIYTLGLLFERFDPSKELDTAS